MRIVYVYQQMVDQAGTERIFTDKMNYLADYAGHEVVLLTYEQCSRSLAFPLSPLIKHIDLGMRNYPLYKYNFFVRLYKWHQLDKELQTKYDSFLLDFHPDVVITTTTYARAVRMVGKCPVDSLRILESHIDRQFIMCNDPSCKENLKNWFRGRYDMHILTKYARKFDRLVALNQPDADDWSRYLKTTTITNMVHLNPTNKLADLVNNHVIFVGRYTEQKGIPDLLKVWEIVHSRYPDWILDMYGDGGMREEIEQMALKLAANIHIHNTCSNIFDCYFESSILVMTSLYEPFGLVLPEAMSCGLPVVAFDCPYGPANIITNEVDGYLIEGRSIDLFAEKVCSLIESRELRLTIGRSAVVSSKRYSPSYIMPIWDSFFNGLQKNLSHK